MKLSQLFTSNAVFKKGSPIRIFGTGTGDGEVEFANIKKNIYSTEDFWETEFPPMEYGGPYTLSFTTGGTCVTLKDIYIGEVYLFAGQSNMAFMLESSNTPKEKYEENERLHLFTVPYDFTGTEIWQRAELGVIEKYSALGYLAGNELAKDKKVHVGIIACTMGASSIRSWLPEGSLKRLGIDIPDEWLHGDHFGEYGEWNHEGNLYEKKLSNVIPFSVDGAVWYQGESNAAEGEAKFYAKMLSEFISVVREKFREELPFTVVQLADTYERMADPGWEIIQKAQAEVANTTKNAYLVISRDISENDDIHPQSKAQLAHRIAEVIKKYY